MLPKRWLKALLSSEGKTVTNCLSLMIQDRTAVALTLKLSFHSLFTPISNESTTSGSTAGSGPSSSRVKST